MENLQDKETLKNSDEFQDFMSMKQNEKAKKLHKKFKHQHTKRDNFSWKNVGKSIKKAGKFVGNAIKHLAGDTLLLPLLPFQPHMKKELERKGFNTKGMDLTDTTSKFYNEVVSKKGNKKSNLEPIDEANFRNLPQFHQSYEEYLQEDHIIDDVIELVSEIISFFKKSHDTLVEAKKTGQDLTQIMTGDEIRAGQHTEKVIDRLNQMQDGERPIRKKDIGLHGGKIQPKHIAIGIGTLLIIIIAVVMFNKK